MIFRDAVNGRTGYTYTGSSFGSGREGYYTGYNGYITWTGRWWRYIASYRYDSRCSVTI